MSHDIPSFQEQMIEIQLENQRMMSEWLTILQKIEAAREVEIHNEQLPSPVDPLSAELTEVKKDVYLTAVVLQALVAARSVDVGCDSVIDDEFKHLYEFRQRQMGLEIELSSRRAKL